MNIAEYNNICGHNRLVRIDDNFVRCLKCGLSIINKKNITGNKSRRDFETESTSLLRNFDRNFSNVLPQVDEQSNIPLYEYYVDKHGMNKIIINKTVAFDSMPAKYEVIVNDIRDYLTSDAIRKMLNNINAIRIDRDQYNSIP